jgi:hypothetical protein
MSADTKNFGLNDQVVDGVTNTNYKTLAEGAAFYSHLGMSAAFYDQQEQRTANRRSVERAELEHANLALERAEVRSQARIANATLAAAAAVQAAVAAKMLFTVSPEQAVDDSKVLTGDDIAAKMASEAGAASLGSLLNKLVSVTPPVTDASATPTKAA